ncbi:glycosyltransferase family 2 protein [Hymenobacter sp. AT01-02]|uniref:glycosyltransferase family 2 protein n=1 Tax=Hymenobacter sp. AT01-02 TaxID=1571877 RepID=UPI0005F2768D|nr:glycosyltransferase family A protein [Hymenobacter sp. AT01-02]
MANASASSCSSPAAGLPLVSIVATCHNHAPFLRHALNSILAQTYPQVEVILIDNGSTDGSPNILQEYAAQQPHWQLHLLPENIGLCRAFNLGYRQSAGEYLVDFATDDVLLPSRLTQQVALFQQLPAHYGVLYSDAELIDEQGSHLRFHIRREGNRLHPQPASGEVFAEVLRRYFISTPTMLMRRATLDALGGYDETLYYEDFDFWVRAARDWHFQFLDAVTTQKRKHPQAMSRTAYRPGDPHLDSTLATCRKALALCRTAAECEALAVRLRWEMRQCVRHGNHQHAVQLADLLSQTRHLSALDQLLARWSRWRCS